MKPSIFLFILIAHLVFFSCKQDQNYEAKLSSNEKISNSSKVPSSKKIVSSSSSMPEKIQVKGADNEDVVIKEKVFKATNPERSSKIKSEVTSTNKLKKSPSKKISTKLKKVGKLTFASKSYDFGFIEMDEVIDHSFYFKNNGNKAVNISNATATCGCTTPLFPFMPIEPGEQGKIDVRFNSKGRLGPQTAIITVFSDTEEKEISLEITGIVRTEIASPSEFIDTTNQ